jgi:hypothetical protein
MSPDPEVNNNTVEYMIKIQLDVGMSSKCPNRGLKLGPESINRGCQFRRYDIWLITFQKSFVLNPLKWLPSTPFLHPSIATFY